MSSRRRRVVSRREHDDCALGMHAAAAARWRGFGCIAGTGAHSASSSRVQRPTAARIVAASNQPTSIKACATSNSGRRGTTSERGRAHTLHAAGVSEECNRSLEQPDGDGTNPWNANYEYKNVSKNVVQNDAAPRCIELFNNLTKVKIRQYMF